MSTITMKFIVIIVIFLPLIHNRERLGWFSTSKEAVAAAKNKYSKVDGCAFCCPESHKR